VSWKRLSRRCALGWAALFLSQSCRGRDAAPGEDTTPPAAGPTAAAREPTCGVDERTALTGDGIGALRVGASVDDVARVCRVLSDTTALGTEGQQERTILVDLGRDSVTAVVSDSRVWRIHVRTPAFRTADSLGVGTPVRTLRQHRPQLLTGEGVFLRLPSHCGLSFRLRDAAPGRVSSPRQLADSIVVDEVLAFGCGAPAGAA
jgi:hypothetical protein